MPVPKIEVTLLEDATINLSLIRRIDATPLDIPISLDELFSNGFDEGARNLGEKILRTLEIWHEDKFFKKEITRKTTPTPPDTYDVAMMLLEISVACKTSKHVPSIDGLFLGYQNDDANRRSFVDDDWPVVRNRLLSFT